jgi:hypothetical protein
LITFLQVYGARDSFSQDYAYEKGNQLVGVNLMSPTGGTLRADDLQEDDEKDRSHNLDSTK